MLKPNDEFLFTRQRHEADKMGLHWDYRFVLGDKAYSFATKKEMPEPGKMIVLFEQPVHDREYALSKKVVIPKGNYGAGVTTLDWVHKATVSDDSTDDKLKLHIKNGQKFLLKKLPEGKYTKKAWLLRNITPESAKPSNKYLEKIAEMYERRAKYKETSWDHLENPVGTKKYDGAHYSLTVQPDGSFTFHSRRPGVSGEHPEKADRVPHFNAVTLPQFAGNRYAVELIHTGHDKENKERHNVLSGILNSKPDKAIKTQKEIGPIRAVLLDVDKPGLTYEAKLEHLKSFEEAYGKPDLLFAATPHYGKEAIEKLRDEVRSTKGEGIIVTDRFLPEEENTRYKEKNFQTYNLRVSGVQQEVSIHGEKKPMTGAFLLEDASGREVARAGGMEHAVKKHAFEAPHKWIGKLIQVKAFPPSKEGGRLRHPIYNGDADGDIDTI